MREVDFHSLTSLPLELWFGERFISNASAFFMRSYGRYFLVTNWHVLSGRHAQTGQPLHKHGAIPTELKISYHGQKLGSHVGPVTIDLQHEREASWYQHPSGQRFDIACIAVDEFPEGSKIYLPTDENVDRPLRKRVGADCFVVGHPIRSPISELLPIWKRGTIASEYHLPFQGKPCFIVDTTTSQGMSGSPVFLRAAGTVQFEGESKLHFTDTQVTEFVGIYSGRLLRSDEGALDLGFVWKKEVIGEMLNDPRPGTYEIVRLN